MKILLIVLVLLVLIILIATAYFLIVRAKFRSEVSRYDQFWEQASQQRQEKGGITYVALGDSTAQGIGASSPEEGYVWQFAQELSAQTGKKVRIVNLSKTGATTADVLANQLPQVAGLAPDIVTTAIGANDIYAGVSTDQLSRNLQQLIAALPPHAIVAEIPYLRWTRRNAGVVAINAEIKKEAAARGLAFAPLYQITRSTRFQIDAYWLDFFHPSDKGYRNWTSAFFAATPPALL
jgi:acyl-CoA thioesterase-1